MHGYQLTEASDTPAVLTIGTRFASRGDLDLDALRAALTALAERHPALRTRYQYDDEGLWRRYWRLCRWTCRWFP